MEVRGKSVFLTSLFVSASKQPHNKRGCRMGAAEKERLAIAQWMRRMAEHLIPAQRDCLLANADIIETNRFIRKPKGQ